MKTPREIAIEDFNNRRSFDDCGPEEKKFLLKLYTAAAEAFWGGEPYNLEEEVEWFKLAHFEGIITFKCKPPSIEDHDMAAGTVELNFELVWLQETDN